MIDAELKAKQAGALFLEGYNCAQSVAAVFADEMHMTREQVLLLSSGFGGGMGGLRRTCGAATGMFMVLSAMTGYDDATDMETKKALYARIRAAEADFAAAFSTSECDTLLKNNAVYVKAEPSERTPEYYRTRPCARFVEFAAKKTADILNELNK